MPTVVVLCNNIFDENSIKRVRGDAFEASEEFINAVLDGDEAAERLPRITEVAKKRGRPPKAAS